MNGQIWLQKNAATINRPLRKKIQQSYLPGRKAVEIPVFIHFKQKRLGLLSFPILKRLILSLTGMLCALFILDLFIVASPHLILGEIMLFFIVFAKATA